MDLKSGLIRSRNDFFAKLKVQGTHVEKAIKIDPRVMKLLMIENSEFWLPAARRSARLKTARLPAEPLPDQSVTSHV